MPFQQELNQPQNNPPNLNFPKFGSDMGCCSERSKNCEYNEVVLNNFIHDEVTKWTQAPLHVLFMNYENLSRVQQALRKFIVIKILSFIKLLCTFIQFIVIPMCCNNVTALYIVCICICFAQSFA